MPLNQVYKRGDILFFKRNPNELFVGVVIHTLNSKEKQTVAWWLQGEFYRTFDSEMLAQADMHIIGNVDLALVEEPAVEVIW